MLHYALILCGGSGTRMGSEVPKQYLPLDGQPLVWHTVRALQSAGRLAGAILVVAPEWKDRVNQWFRDEPFILAVTEGGKERALSARRGFRALESLLQAHGTGLDGVGVLIHDGARPCVGTQVVDAVAQALEAGAHAAVPCIPMTDTVYETAPDGTHHARTLDRRRLVRAQTPQGFQAQALAQLYARADDAFLAAMTDEISALRTHLPDTAVRIVPGDERNVKITTPNDWKRLSMP